MEALQDVLTVRELRLEPLRTELARRMAVLHEIEVELTAAAEEVERVAQQRVMWEHDWQRWMHHDGVLRHGQDYNLSHVALSAWEQDAKDAHAEVLARHEQAAAEANIVRQLLLKAQQHCDVLREQLQSWRRQAAAQRTALLESRLQDDAAVRHRKVSP